MSGVARSTQNWESYFSGSPFGDRSKKTLLELHLRNHQVNDADEAQQMSGLNRLCWNSGVASTFAPHLKHIVHCLVIAYLVIAYLVIAYLVIAYLVIAYLVIALH